MPGTRHGIRATLDRWLPSRFLRASLWFHLVCAVIIIIHPAAWPWVVGALIVARPSATSSCSTGTTASLPGGSIAPVITSMQASSPGSASGGRPAATMPAMRR